jgi:hypothetical protein
MYMAPMRPGSVADGASAMVCTNSPVASSKITQPGKPLMRAASRRQARLVGSLAKPMKVLAISAPP